MPGGLTGCEAVTTDLTEVSVAIDTYRVSSARLLLTAELRGALALCLHDEGRGVGGLLHLLFADRSGRPAEVTDNTLSGVLVVLDRFKREVFGTSARAGEVHARILAHALPAEGGAEPSASLVDLIRADLADGRLTCGAHILRRPRSVRVHFEPCAGRVWIAGPQAARTEPRRRHGL